VSRACEVRDSGERRRRAPRQMHEPALQDAPAPLMACAATSGHVANVAFASTSASRSPFRAGASLRALACRRRPRHGARVFVQRRRRLADRPTTRPMTLPSVQAVRKSANGGRRGRGSGAAPRRRRTRGGRDHAAEGAEQMGLHGRARARPAPPRPSTLVGDPTTSRVSNGPAAHSPAVVSDMCTPLSGSN